MIKLKCYHFYVVHGNDDDLSFDHTNKTSADIRNLHEHCNGSIYIREISILKLMRRTQQNTIFVQCIVRNGITAKPCNEMSTRIHSKVINLPQNFIYKLIEQNIRNDWIECAFYYHDPP